MATLDVGGWSPREPRVGWPGITPTGHCRSKNIFESKESKKGQVQERLVAQGRAKTSKAEMDEMTLTLQGYLLSISIKHRLETSKGSDTREVQDVLHLLQTEHKVS
jgi:hypothetical protein